ncbi:membrane protein [Intrasporangium chromatireducens Q5-1]|uniref:Membrane protein n=1 Tax=Intrasporangium chromatireducens Q5-1 TaxID=584657 RepID=W9GJ78_9MICO|nr:MFS transporter [Intrasporangium chromatireducens]EWT06135.1 membrane protein [Intrasporangium chromatireducens Q5-1]
MSASTTDKDVQPLAAPTRSERLDRLAFNARHRRLLVGSGVGWALDAMDVGLISFVMAALAKQWGLDATQLSWIGSIGFVGMAIGASVGGLLADRLGRRNVFALTLLVYGIATGAAGLSTGIAMLIVLRFVVGLGLGAELPVASTLVSEYAPSRIRGRIVVILEAFWAVGWILAALIGYFVVPASENGWRWALFLGIVPALYAVVVRAGLPESVRFLESRGRTAEAEAAVRSFEAASGVAPVPSPVAEVQSRPSWSALWDRSLRRRSAALWVTWFGVNFSYYGAFIWIPSLLVADGFSLTKSFGFTLVITLAQLPGYAAAAFLIERWGRRATLASFLLGSAASAVLFGQAGSEAAIIAAGCALSFFNLGAWGALYAVTPEVYPTALRGSGAGSAAAFGRIASILAPLSVPWLLGAGGHGLVFGVFGAAFVVAALAALALPEWRGRALAD